MSRQLRTALPQVSVVMPSFNAADTIVDSIESVQQQTIADWEMIIVDDGSSDETVALVEQVTLRDPRVRIIQQANSGPSVARNRGVSEAQAAVVAFLDSDDLWEPRHLELNLANLSKCTDLGVSFSPCRLMSADGQLTGEMTAAWLDDVTIANILSCNPSSTCSALVVRKTAFEETQGFDKRMVHAEDQEWLYRVLTSGWRMRGLAEATVRYRLSPKGLSADTERMHGGWKAFIASAQAHTPEAVAQHLPKARASMNLYFARRLLRDGDTSSSMRQHLWISLRSYPGIAFDQPKTIAVLLLSLLLPQSAIDQLLKLRGVQHA